VPSAGGSAAVEIAVPDEQAEPAREFLQRWDNFRAPSSFDFCSRRVTP